MERNHDSSAPAAGMATLVVRIIRLPFDAFLFSVEIFTATLRGLQRLTDERGGGEVPVPPRDGAGSRVPRSRDPAVVAPAANPDPPKQGDRHDSPNYQKEPATMPDTNLNDDMLKLVRYKILFVKRDYEVAFPEQEEFVHDNMSETAFTAWKIAEFIQALRGTNVPAKWAAKKYPFTSTPEAPDDVRDRWQAERDPAARRIHWLPEGDKKYLRVYFEVLSRYAREKFKHDEREVEVLEEIRDVLRDKAPVAAAPAQGSGSGPGGGQASSSGKGGGGRGGAGAGDASAV